MNLKFKNGVKNGSNWIGRNVLNILLIALVSVIGYFGDEYVQSDKEFKKEVKKAMESVPLHEDRISDNEDDIKDINDEKTLSHAIVLQNQNDIKWLKYVKANTD